MDRFKPVFQYDAIRARQARLALRLQTKFWHWFLGATVGVLLFVGGGVIIIWQSFFAGISVISFAIWPMALAIWYKNYLNNLVPDNRSDFGIHNIVEVNLLGKMPQNASPKQLAKIAMQVPGGYFFMLRFGIGPTFVEDLSSDLPADSTIVWQRANQLREQFNQPVIDGAMLVVALVEQIPNNDALLAQLQLDIQDLLTGIGWFEHIRQAVNQSSQRKSSGGVGRDWSFGYTPLLSRFAQNITDNVMQGGLLRRDLVGQQNVLLQIIRLLSEGGRHNAVLVGPTGVGKTTLVYALAEQLMKPVGNLPKNLRYQQVMALDPASLIAQARGRGELEALVQSLFMEAIKAKNIVLFLDNAQLFLQNRTGAVDLSNLLLSVLDGGSLRIILAMDEQRWLQLSQINPGLAQYMNRINMQPLSQIETMQVMEDQLFVAEFQHGVRFMYQATKEAYRLGERYVKDQSMPGQAISLLEAAARVADNGLVTVKTVQLAVEKVYGVKVANADDIIEKQTLLNLEDLIHRRMINQTRAVKVVANALRRARAGVRSQSRPIGTFMFLGPTGVGKTELAKSLAAVYFGGEDHLIRLDLNEFGQLQDVDRLLVDGSHDANSLIAQISKQPFSVVLLDEIEKAHPNVLNTLLQLLDEGILRDVNNRPASFKDAIIIATSNAGADKIRQRIDSGKQLEQFEDSFVDDLINSGQFKPEFLNRFDEIVLFRPLNQAELKQVVGLMLEAINKTLAPQKITVKLDDQAQELLVKKAYDPRLGARPLRRIVQRTVEDIIARRLLGGDAQPGSVVNITTQDIEEILKNDIQKIS